MSCRQKCTSWRGNKPCEWESTSTVLVFLVNGNILCIKPLPSKKFFSCSGVVCHEERRARFINICIKPCICLSELSLFCWHCFSRQTKSSHWIFSSFKRVCRHSSKSACHSGLRRLCSACNWSSSWASSNFLCASWARCYSLKCSKSSMVTFFTISELNLVKKHKPVECLDKLWGLRNVFISAACRVESRLKLIFWKAGARLLCFAPHQD